MRSGRQSTGHQGDRRALTSGIVVFTDLDGCLLDASTYSFDAAIHALGLLRERRIPLVLASSKTRAEIEPIRDRLECQDPFIAENGGALFVPRGYFPFHPEGAVERDRYDVIAFGTPYPILRLVMTDLRRRFGDRVRGFGDLSDEEVVALTGLNSDQARRAKQREYDEPFVLECDPALLDDVKLSAQAHGLSCTKGGRFHHLMGPSDKGRACRYLIECYRRDYGDNAQPLQTVALGDSQNDLPMFAAVERPILLQQPDGSYDPGVNLPHLLRADGIGPVGWNHAILALLR